MNEDIDNRLRAHFADRAEHEALPTVPGDVPVLRAPRPRWQRPSWLAAAAAVLVLAGVAAGLALADEDGAEGVDVVGTDGSTTTTAATASTTVATSVAPAEAGGRASTRSVIVAGDVLGWWDGTRWVRGDSGEPVPVVGGERYQLIGLEPEVSVATGSAPEPGCELRPDPPPHIQMVREDASSPAPYAVAVSGIEDPLLRPLESLDLDNVAYRDIAREVLADLGIEEAAPPITQLVRTDLEGDGVDEVLMTIEKVSDPDHLFGKTGDYSLVVLRRVVEGQAVTQVVHSFVVPSNVEIGDGQQYILIARIGAVADLNGDGRMELVVSSFYYEGSGTTVYDVLTMEGAVEVLSGGCGA